MTTTILQGKHIVLGITGGIAAYKSATLLRLLVKKGAEVQVVMTPSAKEFITPVTLSALSGRPVVSDFFTANSGEWHSHVELGLWADAMIVAPATACTIAKMATGVADNMLVTTYLSAREPVFIAPAMDLDMMAHPSTKHNLETLKSYGNHIIEPAEGELASHLVGKGRMEEPEKIVEYLENFFLHSHDLAGKKFLITAGPTYEKIDPVRFIGNYSSGKTGYALADEAARRGADVTLVSGPVAISPSESTVKVVKVESAIEMLDACRNAFSDADFAIMSAAVADYAPEHHADRKIKREKEAIPQIKLKKNPDIAATLGAMKRPEQKLVGFALETDNAMENARLKMSRKNLDMIVLNSISADNKCFNTDTNSVTIITDGGHSVSQIPQKDKRELAHDIIDACTKL